MNGDRVSPGAPLGPTESNDGHERRTEAEHRKVAGLQGSAGALILRDVTLADLDAIAAMEAVLFVGDAWSRELVREEISGQHRRYLALDDEATGRLVGYAGLLAVGAEGDVQTIAVAPEYRGQGQGRRLMQALIAVANEAGVRELFLEVRADNPVAQALYISLGFAEIGVRKGYYQPGGIDAVVMRLSPLPTVDCAGEPDPSPGRAGSGSSHAGSTGEGT